MWHVERSARCPTLTSPLMDSTAHACASASRSHQQRCSITLLWSALSAIPRCRRAPLAPEESYSRPKKILQTGPCGRWWIFPLGDYMSQWCWQTLAPPHVYHALRFLAFISETWQLDSSLSHSTEAHYTTLIYTNSASYPSMEVDMYSQTACMCWRRHASGS